MQEHTVPGMAVGRAAVQLPWLCPNTDSLVSLAEQPARLPALAVADPALLAFLLRFGPTTQNHSAFWLTPDRFQSPALPEIAATYLSTTASGWLNPTSATAEQLRSFVAVATINARRLAACAPQVSADAAAAAAALSALGWFAVAAINADSATECLNDPAFRMHPARTQQSLWTLDHDSIARRLAVRWRFPAWLGSMLGLFNLPLRAARAAIVDADLFAIVQLAVHEAERRTVNLALTRHADRAEALTQLGIKDSACESYLHETPLEHAASPEMVHDPDPKKVPLVRNLLVMAADARRRHGAALVLRLEDRVEELHQALAGLAQCTDHSIREAKLTALAELAAGAGHEINNPLAVISGNAQRLLRTEQDTAKEDALRLIVRQTQRINGILRDLMQFARPPRPEVQRFAASELFEAARDELAVLARERNVRLELISFPAEILVDADGNQLRHAVIALVRNAIEAATGGWVRLTGECRDQRIAFVIEDSGPGLDEEAVEHAFDPFFSGRSAGRGRGLGLPTAWRLARENGGTVQHESRADGPTRFTLTIPRTSEPTLPPYRKTA